SVKAGAMRGAACVAALLLSGCVSRHRPADSGLGFVDVEGRPVALANLPVHRIVSTMQSATEWLVQLGAAPMLLARTDYDHEPELATLPSIGGGLDPSPEAVAALRPDVVIGWRNRSSADLARALRPFHIPVLSFETTDTADMFRNLARLGILVGRSGRADSLAAQLRHDLAGVRDAGCPGGVDPANTALVILWIDPPMTVGAGTWLDTVLSAACLRNVFGDVAAPWPTVSMEAILARQPRWIVTSRTTGTGQDQLDVLRGKPGWRDLAAVRAGRVLEIPADLLARAGPSIARAALALDSTRRAVDSAGR
ncbi:MAG: ABC transporter substrate-binding protein, partial [Gemmatimonadales bacterium]